MQSYFDVFASESASSQLVNLVDYAPPLDTNDKELIQIPKVHECNDKYLLMIQHVKTLLKSRFLSDILCF